MKDISKRQQVVDQCKAIVKMAENIVQIHKEYEEIFKTSQLDDLIDLVGDRTAYIMENLGNILNGLDAVREDDAWIDSIFERSREIFPRPEIEF